MILVAEELVKLKILVKYKIWESGCETIHQDLLNEFEREGWQLATVVQCRGRHYYYFAMFEPTGEMNVRKFEEGKARREANWDAIRQIATLYRIAEDDEKVAIIAKANALGLAGENATKEDFLKALGEHSDAPPEAARKLEELRITILSSNV